MRRRDYELNISEIGGVRSLHFGSSWVQGAMRIRRPYALELAYTREMMACLLLRPADNDVYEVLMIGLGAGSLAKFVYRGLPHARTTVVEIDPRMAPMTRLFFSLPDDPLRLNIVVADGADYVQATNKCYDLILIDGFGPDGRAGRLDTVKFYDACRKRLSSRGLVACNLLGRNRGFDASVRRIDRAFDGRSIVFPSLESGNTIAFAAAGETVDVSLEDMRLQAMTLKRVTGLDLRATLHRLAMGRSLPQGRLLL